MGGMSAVPGPFARLPLLIALAASPAAAAPDVADSPKAPAVVSGEWLEKQPNVVLLDARPLRDFLAAHLPGAQSVAPDNLRSTAGGVPGAIYPPDLLGAVFARAGAAGSAHVVVYGAESDVDATYVATAARIAGAANVSVLDGGFARWKAEGRPTTAERLRVPPGRPEGKGDASLLVTLEEAQKRVSDGKTVFLDVRSPEAWAQGRIPGSRNRPWKKDVESGSFRPAEAIRAELEAAGVSWEKPVVVYCNSGHQASEAFWLLRYVLRHPDARLYQGSWLEWSMTPGTPRETSAPAEPAPR